MSLKSKFAHKFYIEQYIINEMSFQEWQEKQYSKLVENNAIIGYMFSAKEGNVIYDEIEVLNIYLIDRKYYNGQEVTIDNLANAWRLFKCKTLSESNHKDKIVFLNPPIQQWLDSKDNWCKKVASQISKQYNWPFEEALSEVYYTIMYCYSKGTVYMGNLGYIRTAINNSVLMSIRSNKNRVNQDSGLAVSLDTIVTSDSDDEDLTLMDMIESGEEVGSELEYEELKERITNLLSKYFSEREIEQLLTQKPICLPMNLYRRLLNFRKKYKSEDIYDEKNC